MSQRIDIQHTWDGAPIEPHEHVTMDVRPHDDGLVVAVNAPFYGDPPPPTAPGSTPGLWEFEVVELFVASDRVANPAISRIEYLEIELGPHGHFLVLQFRGVRREVASGLAIAYRAEQRDGRWHGEATIPAAYLPPAPWKMNAYAIHGVAPQRRYLAWAPLPGKSPDYHQPDAFRQVELASC